MIRSMTGFGQSSREVGGYHMAIDMKSVNHRYCEVAVRMPREWLALEEPLKKLILRQVRRGRVDVFVQAERGAGAERAVTIDWPVVEAYLQAAEQLRVRLNRSDDLALRDLLAIPDAVRLADAAAPAMEEIEAELLGCAGEALERLIAMRRTEGEHLRRDLAERLNGLRRLADELRRLAPQAVDEHRARLRSRIEELLADTAASFDEQRFAMEIALYADRSNVDEELTRLASHFHQFGLLLAEREPVGRKLDFLLQEMNREANTIGSKTGQPIMAGLVVELKAELEKIREQAQNVE